MTIGVFVILRRNVQEQPYFLKPERKDELRLIKGLTEFNFGAIQIHEKTSCFWLLYFLFAKLPSFCYRKRPR